MRGDTRLKVCRANRKGEIAQRSTSACDTHAIIEDGCHFRDSCGGRSQFASYDSHGSLHDKLSCDVGLYAFRGLSQCMSVMLRRRNGKFIMKMLPGGC